MNIDEISISKIPSYIGKSIKDTKIRDMYDLIIVCAIKSDKNSFVNPSSDYIINEGDTIMVIGDKDKLDKFLSFMISLKFLKNRILSP